MTDSERLDRLERIVLLSTRDTDGWVGVEDAATDEWVRLVGELRAEHTYRSGGQLILTT